MPAKRTRPTSTKRKKNTNPAARVLSMQGPDAMPRWSRPPPEVLDAREERERREWAARTPTRKAADDIALLEYGIQTAEALRIFNLVTCNVMRIGCPRGEFDLTTLTEAERVELDKAFGKVMHGRQNYVETVTRLLEQLRARLPKPRRIRRRRAVTQGAAQAAQG